VSVCLCVCLYVCVSVCLSVSLSVYFINMTIYLHKPTQPDRALTVGFALNQYLETSPLFVQNELSVLLYFQNHYTSCSLVEPSTLSCQKIKKKLAEN
jgi:hypothetical protein